MIGPDSYTVVIHETEPDETGFWAEVAELPGCFACGAALAELHTDLQNAIETYVLALESRRQEGFRYTDY